MAQPMEYTVGPNAERGGVITYGKCEKSPYVENGLWFVHVPRIWETSTTFLVDEKYANPKVMDEFQLFLERWSEVARLTIPGSDWNPQAECRWREMPFYIHTLPDGTPIRYGLSRSQSADHPDRELWYVVIGHGVQESNWSDYYGYNIFVVDKLCTEPDFMNRMGSDTKRWRNICWAAPVGVEPWFATIDQVPDPYRVIKKDEAKAQRPLWQKLLDKLANV